MSLLPDGTCDTQHIYDEWISFAESIGLGNAPPVQIQEMQRAFYAGATAFLHIITSLAEAGIEPTDNDMQLMEDLQAELEQFAKAVKEGRA